MRLAAKSEWMQVNATPKVDVLPYELVNGNRVGTTVRWDLAMEYRIARYVNLSFPCFGRKEPGRPRTPHLGKMEVRAFF